MKTRRIKMLVLLSIMIVSSILVTSTQAQTDNNVYLPLIFKGRATPTPTYGTSTFGMEITSFSRVNDAANANNHWVRYNALKWSDVQPNNANEWYWDPALGQNLKAASDLGMEVILIIRNTPSWAQKYAGWYCGPMAEGYIDEFANFMYQAVKEYSQYGVKYFELWNEPDTARVDDLFTTNPYYGCWGETGDAAVGAGQYYGQVLKAIYPQVKAANPNAQLVIGGLLMPCYPKTYSEGWLTDYCKSTKFVDGIMSVQANSTSSIFDYASFHGYTNYDPVLSSIQHEKPNKYNDSDNYWPWWNDQGGLVEGKLSYLRNAMTIRGINKPILLTEGGFLDINGLASDIDAFEAKKANYLVWLYARNIARDIKGTIWYNGGWGNSDLWGRPAYDAFQLAASKLDGAIYQKDLSLGAGIRGFEFLTKSGRIWVVFTVDDTWKEFTKPASDASVYDLFGGSNYFSISNTTIGFYRPIYIEFQ